MHSPSIEIVELPVEEWRAYRQLRLEALQESPQAFGSSYKDQLEKPDSFWQSRLEEAANGEKSWLLFARVGDQPVGMIGAFLGGIENPEASDQAFIIAMYVTPAWRGRSISRLLMHAILSTLKDHDIHTVRLGVNVEQTVALHLYERFGFSVIRFDNLPMGDGITHKGYLMEKTL
jgi:ribosomal protein S18 acetylase RimI-like enzyme